MTNYKNAPYTVASFWSMKTALRLVTTGYQISWYDNYVQPSTDDLLDDLVTASASSILVYTLHRSMAGLFAVRHLSSFRRGPVEVRLGEFILASAPNHDGLLVGLVAEMVEAFCVGASFIRILFDEARAVGEVDSERGGVFTVWKSQPCIQCDPVCVEHSAICELHAWLDENSRYTFTY